MTFFARNLTTNAVTQVCSANLTALEIHDHAWQLFRARPLLQFVPTTQSSLSKFREQKHFQNDLHPTQQFSDLRLT
ncbi:hypothetical protein Plhal304r1_c027g0089361 [Plasmopara halstedii]